MLSCLSRHGVLLVMRQVSSMLVCRLFVGLRNNLHRLISVVVHALVTHNFLQHLQLVLSAISFQLLFLHKLALGLLTHDYRSADLLRLCKVLALRDGLSGLSGASYFAVRYFQRFLSSFCHIVVMKLGLVDAESTCINFMDNHGILHSLEF
jgi:hypothetical protein